MTEAATAFCAYHHRTAAVAECAVCARPVCGLCVTTVNASRLCTGCGVGRASQLGWLAAAFSLLLPGAGQAYNGQFGKAVAVFFLAPLVVPWLWGVYDAATTAESIARGETQSSTLPTGGVVLALKIIWVPAAMIYGSLAAMALAALAGAIGTLVS